MEFAVVTKVPPAGDPGNLATACGRLFLDPQAKGGSWDDPRQPLGEALGQPMLELYVQCPVFDLGEVLVMGDDGRELIGAGRKPSKWDVEVEMFATIGEAVKRAAAVAQGRRLHLVASAPCNLVQSGHGINRQEHTMSKPGDAIRDAIYTSDTGSRAMADVGHALERIRNAVKGPQVAWIAETIAALPAQRRAAAMEDRQRVELAAVADIAEAWEAAEHPSGTPLDKIADAVRDAQAALTALVSLNDLMHEADRMDDEQ